MKLYLMQLNFIYANTHICILKEKIGCCSKLEKYDTAFLIDCSSLFLVALAYRNPIMTLRID